MSDQRSPLVNDPDPTSGTPQGFFAVSARLPASEPVGGFFRSLRSTSPRHRQQALAYVQLARELTLELEKFVALPDLNVPRFPLSADRQPAARRDRREGSRGAQSMETARRTRRYQHERL